MIYIQVIFIYSIIPDSTCLLIYLQEFLKDLDSLVVAFEKETTASGQRNVLSKIQHGLIAAQDIGDDKLITVQAMSDLIENKSR